MGQREVKAFEVLQAGGFFRTALERTYMGEKFVTRLRTAEGLVVKGVGWATFQKFQEEGKLVRKECFPGSTWRREYGLKAEVA